VFYCLTASTGAPKRPNAARTGFWLSLFRFQGTTGAPTKGVGAYRPRPGVGDESHNRSFVAPPPSTLRRGPTDDGGRATVPAAHTKTQRGSWGGSRCFAGR
jgi:hypothetical protein